MWGILEKLVPEGRREKAKAQPRESKSAAAKFSSPILPEA